MTRSPCPHEPTTVAFAYGEAPDDHALHIAACPACAEVLAVHEAVAGAIPLAALSRAPSARRAARWPAVAAVALLAAAAVAGIVKVSVPETASPPAPVVAAEARSPEPLDAALDDLDLELTALEMELL